VIELRVASSGYFAAEMNIPGALAPQDTNTLPVRVLTLREDRIAMIVDTPEGPVTLDGTLSANGQSLEGTVVYHHGSGIR